MNKIIVADIDYSVLDIIKTFESLVSSLILYTTIGGCNGDLVECYADVSIFSDEPVWCAFKWPEVMLVGSSKLLSNNASVNFNFIQV